MRLSDETYEYIKEEVVDLFERYDVRCIPISGSELALKMGITLIPFSSLSAKKLNACLKASEDGYYFEPGDGREIIYYNDSLNYTRINMTILHEIGHCVLGHTDDMDADVVESEAAFFAKYALAPPPLVHRIRPEYPDEIEDFFDIGYEAAYYAFDYYQKWLRKFLAVGCLYPYETRLLQLFQESSQGGKCL